VFPDDSYRKLLFPFLTFVVVVVVVVATPGVGYGWVDSLKEIAEREVSDQMFANAANRYPHNTPTTKEGYRYRMIFEEFFPGEAAERTVPGGKTIACSTERAMNWDASFASRADPSGRSAGVHEDAYGDAFVADTVLEDPKSPATKKAKVAANGNGVH
jgi:asparagine synthase (glutamine-hydrolysing)